ncbi:hypothetical protein TNCV_1089441 [Trichonephila clavipes]|uniref:Uncharacterized protein n=1 Tax=Trichonephila clavipes TaxID=2585209 RepID=A0A8X6VQ49_TRICX|nr:hypothetical protein TNCV_1089441 [Trichonephila clavipes]
MTRSVAKRPRVAEQCDVNIHSLHTTSTGGRLCLEVFNVHQSLHTTGLQWHQDSNSRIVDVEVWRGGWKFRCRRSTSITDTLLQSETLITS